MLVPSLLVALRGLFPSAKSVKAVVVSALSVTPTRATVRGMVAAALLETLDVPTPVSYPVAMRYWPLPDRVSIPSDTAVPLAVRGLLAPLAMVGSPTDCTRVPVGLYSSRETWALAL